MYITSHTQSNLTAWSLGNLYYKGRLQQEAAEAKARKLLLAKLTPKQRECFQKHNFFYVRTNKGTYYALADGRRAIGVSRQGKPTRVREAYPWDTHRPRNSTLSLLPRSDRLLGQKLMLESNERKFRETACVMTYSEWMRFQGGLSRRPKGPYERIESGEYFQEYRDEE